MIYIKRPKTAPAVFSSPVMKKARKAILDFYKIPVEERGQLKLPYVQLGAVTLRTLRKELDKLFSKKCAYCESIVGDIYYGDFDHFRPRTSARGLDNEFSASHYGWLAYTWNNMYLSCQECNKHKLNWFPVDGQRIEPLTAYDKTIKTEKALLIDPCNDRPEKHLNFLPNGKVMSITKKGETTLELLNLNRSFLVSRRKEILDHLESELLPATKELKRKVVTSNLYTQIIRNVVRVLEDLGKERPQRPFSAAQRAFIITWLEKEKEVTDFIFHNHSSDKLNQEFLAKLKPYRLQLKKLISVFYNPQKSSTPEQKPVTRKLKQVKITNRINLEKIIVKNFKALEDVEVLFPDSKNKYESWLMFLGENGVGKSSMLQAISMALMGSKYFATSGPKLKAKDILRHETQDGFVKICTKESDDPITMTFSSRHAGIKHSHPSPPSFLLAYGSTRLFKTGSFREEAVRGLVKTKNMFDPSYALTDARKWILSIKDEKLFDKVAIAIKDLLLFSNKEKLVRRNGKVYVEYTNKPPDTLDELSDGYKSVIAVTVDIMRTLIQANTTMEVAEGIVLLDEIGTHLHPRWRMEVVKRFRNVFPKLQFIVTTHDPLCLRGLKEGEVVVFNKDEKHKVFTITDLPDPSEYRIDQLLTSPFFGLNTVVDPVLEKKFNEYYYLLSRPLPTDAQKKKIEKLRKTLEPLTHLGATWRESLIYKAVDEVIAINNVKTTVNTEVKTVEKQAETQQPTPASSAQKKIEEEVKARVREMWNEKSEQKA
ncbi:MAG: AAA family ATPase [Chitinophagaceae bacterium]